jgi:hypothetical protein
MAHLPANPPPAPAPTPRTSIASEIESVDRALKGLITSLRSAARPANDAAPEQVRDALARVAEERSRHLSLALKLRIAFDQLVLRASESIAVAPPPPPSRGAETVEELRAQLSRAREEAQRYRSMYEGQKARWEELKAMRAAAAAAAAATPGKAGGEPARE